MEASMLTTISKRKRFQLSSFSPELKERLRGYIKQLGGTYLDKQIFAKQVTHIVCAKPNRGEKYLGGCVSGKWVLQKEYIEESFKHGSWLCEDDYEWRSDVLDSENPLASLYDAPRKWRKSLKNKRGAFDCWKPIILVRDNKMKKAYERLLEAGWAAVVKKNAPLQDKNFMKEVTHIFVEADLKPEVKCFEAEGIPCLSPDYIAEYIIQVSEQQARNKFNMKERNSSILLNAIKLPLKHGCKRGVLPGNKNEQTGLSAATSARGPTFKKAGTKRPAISDCGLCIAKRQKTLHNSFSHYQIYGRKETENQNGRNLPLEFPTYISSLVESYFDEGCTLLVLDSVSSSLSKSHAPTSECLHMIMNQLLLNSPSKHQAMKSYNLLHEMLQIHPPSSCQALYLTALSEPSEASQNNREVSAPWHFISKVIRSPFEKDSTNGDITRMQENAQLLLQFIDTLFKQDACSSLKNQTPLILHVLWPCETKKAIKEFLTLCFRCVKLAVHDSTKLMICHAVLDMLSLVITLKRIHNNSDRDCEYLAQQLFVLMSCAMSSKAMKLFFQSCHSSWLKMTIAELILGNFDKSLIPKAYRQLMNKKLSLNKIKRFLDFQVCCYFYLMPTTRTVQESHDSWHSTDSHVTSTEKDTTAFSSLSGNSTGNNSEPKVRIRKNSKGETPLHVACIQNNVAKVERILKQAGVEVNAADNAGWTALHEACNHGHVKCVEKILQYHEKTNAVNLLAEASGGITVLHDAVMNNHLPVVKLLLQAGRIQLLNAKTSTGETAIDLARNESMIDLLKSERMQRQERNDRALDHPEMRTPRPADYAKLRTIQTGKLLALVATPDCELYLFVVGQLIQNYMKENVCLGKHEDSDRQCENCKADLNCLKNLSQHLNALENHVKHLAAPQPLSAMSKLYITTMRLCISPQ